MLTFSALYENLLWLSLPLLCIALVLLYRCIVGVVRLVRSSLVARLPLAEETRLGFADAGKVVLCMEGPRFSARFRKLRYTLVGEDGSEVAWSRRWFRGVTSGVSTVRMELRNFFIPAPGRYVLRVEGVNAEEDPRNSFVFMRPHLLKSLAYVVGITLSSGLAVVSLVFSLLRIFEVPVT